MHLARLLKDAGGFRRTEAAPGGGRRLSPRRRQPRAPLMPGPGMANGAIRGELRTVDTRDFPGDVTKLPVDELPSNVIHQEPRVPVHSSAIDLPSSAPGVPDVGVDGAPAAGRDPVAASLSDATPLAAPGRPPGNPGPIPTDRGFQVMRVARLPPVVVTDHPEAAHDAIVGEQAPWTVGVTTPWVAPWGPTVATGEPLSQVDPR